MSTQSPRTRQLAAASLLTCAVALPQAASADFHFEGGLEVLSGEIRLGDVYSPDYTPPPTGSPDPGFPPTGTPPPTAPPPTSELSTEAEDYDGWAVSGTWYVGGVDTSRGPLRLAPFMSRASSIGGRIGEIETDSGVDADFYLLDTRWVLGNGVIIEADYGQADGGGGDADIARVAGGYYFADTSAVRLGYDSDDDDLADYERWTVDVTHVQTMENGMTWSLSALFGFVTGDTAFGEGDDGNDLQLAGSFFPRDNFGFGFEVAFAERDATGDVDAYELWADYFVTEKISLTLSYRDEDGDVVENDALNFEARYRF